MKPGIRYIVTKASQNKEFQVGDRVSMDTNGDILNSVALGWMPAEDVPATTKDWEIEVDQNWYLREKARLEKELAEINAVLGAIPHLPLEKPMTRQEDMMRNYPPSLAATKKLGSIADGFSFYAFEWLGDKPEEWTVMKCSGAVFREAKTGPRKGQRCIKVPGTERTAFVTRDEIRAEVPNAEVSGAVTASDGMLG